jgi:gliding motility-associated-like protein
MGSKSQFPTYFIILQSYNRKSNLKMNLYIKSCFSLLLITLGLSTKAQLVSYPDTVCVNQDVFISTSLDTAQNYYWGTSSAWVNNPPRGGIIAANSPLNGPTAINFKKDGDQYYLFASNYNPSFELIRYDFGTNPGVLPTPNNLGNFSNNLPSRITGLDLYQENGQWYGFAIGGIGVNSSIARLDFGTSLSNTPSVTNLGNLAGLLVSPQDIHFFKEAGNYYAYYFNGLSSNLVLLNFGSSITATPTVADLGNPGGLAFPTDMKIMEQAGSYYGFVVNRLSSTLTRLDFGTSLLNVPVVINLGNFGSILNAPRYVSIFKEDNNFYGYITNEANNNLTYLQFNSNISNIPTANNTSNFANFNGPRGISDFYRYKDNVYGFVANYLTNSISQIHYDSTTFATILKDTTKQPPVFQYTKAGTYNLLFQATDTSGKMIEEQHRIVVLNLPKLDLHNDTLICQGDTIFMVANGSRLSKIKWSPAYNLLYQDDTSSVYVYPNENSTYNIHLEFDYGCIFDTMINVQVSRVNADAGEDRVVGDGAVTELGGVGTTLGFQYKYKWTPNLYLNQDDIAAPSCRLTDSLQFYYLEVTNDIGCKDRDTVGVKSFCGDINCPNAFNPVSVNAYNRSFGIENYQLNKLDYFRVFDRYGQMVFETTNPNIKWDGLFNSIPQPMGTYVWMAEGICNNGRKVRRTGNVTLIR